MADKRLHIVGRIAQKQADFMGELRLPGQTPGKIGNAGRGVFQRIAQGAQQGAGAGAFQVCLQPAGAVDVNKRSPLLTAQGQHPHALGQQQPVAPGKLRVQRPDIGTAAAEQAAGLQPGQGGGAVPHNQLLQHVLILLK
ncbi:hypothetical protein SDC9_193825 [bioreactor metagenome]|uniref:Uncharacterized protein n=1 Tax=bioreactor metagenome TaxID=1076179 RepID=A0A645I621_9ZZZZ